MFQKISGMEKNFMVRGDVGGITFSVEIFLAHSVEKIRRGALLCLKKILVSKIFTQKRLGVRVRIRWWASRFCRNFFSHSAEKLRVENFRYEKKFMGKKGWGGATVSSKILSHGTEPNNFVR